MSGFAVLLLCPQFITTFTEQFNSISRTNSKQQETSNFTMSSPDYDQPSTKRKAEHADASECLATSFKKAKISETNTANTLNKLTTTSSNSESSKSNATNVPTISDNTGNTDNIKSMSIEQNKLSNCPDDKQIENSKQTTQATQVTNTETKNSIQQNQSAKCSICKIKSFATELDHTNHKNSELHKTKATQYYKNKKMDAAARNRRLRVKPVSGFTNQPFVKYKHHFNYCDILSSQRAYPRKVCFIQVERFTPYDLSNKNICCVNALSFIAAAKKQRKNIGLKKKNFALENICKEGEDILKNVQHAHTVVIVGHTCEDENGMPMYEPCPAAKERQIVSFSDLITFIMHEHLQDEKKTEHVPRNIILAVCSSELAKENINTVIKLSKQINIIYFEQKFIEGVSTIMGLLPVVNSICNNNSSLQCCLQLWQSFDSTNSLMWQDKDKRILKPQGLNQICPMKCCNVSCHMNQMTFLRKEKNTELRGQFVWKCDKCNLESTMPCDNLKQFDPAKYVIKKSMPKLLHTQNTTPTSNGFNQFELKSNNANIKVKT